MTDDLDGRKLGRKSWPWGVLIATTLFGLIAGGPFLRRHVHWMDGPAPSWVGLLVLAVPVVVGALYIAVQVRDARRRRRGWTAGSGRGRDGDGGCGGGGSGCSGSDSGCGGGHGGCGGGSGCGGGGCGGGGD
jgi:hypothetical protein